ncbi:DNA polymerase [Acidocella sp.]|uniref:DNA polymerase n=1 Tax=Acidocella sp. TaxID=50710 RepID=UPI003D0500C8
MSDQITSLPNSSGDAEENQRAYFVKMKKKHAVKIKKDRKCRKSDGVISNPDDTGIIMESALVFVGFDTEWCKHPQRKKSQNIVLAYGLSVVCGEKTCSVVVTPSGPERRHRLSLGLLLGRALQGAIDKGVLPAMPERVVVGVHFGRGDFAACRDFGRLKPQLAAVKGTLASGGRDAVLALETEAQTGVPFEQLPRVPYSERDVIALDRNRNATQLRVQFLDTHNLAPEGASLEALGALLGYPKIRLPDGYHASGMDVFQAEQPALFDAYLRRDAEITARYAQRFAMFCTERLGLPMVPGTLGGAAVMLFRRMLKQGGIDESVLFGTRLVERTRYLKATGKMITVRERLPTFATRLINEAAGDAYHGGRTETFLTGPVHAGDLLRDIDLRSAYPSAMAAIGVPNYSSVRIVREGDEGALEAFRVDVLGVAEVEFETPPHIRFPVFGVRTRHGLIFPKRGTAVATAPEIASAISLGVSVKITLGVVIEWDRATRPYEDFVVQMAKLRESFKQDGRDTLESKTVKVITNSLYGKTAQAVHKSTAFDMLTGGSKQLKPSAVTCAPFAAYTTGLVRAAIAEMLNSIPAHRQVVSVSTDGFLTDAALDEIAVDGPAALVLGEARGRLAQLTGSARREARAELLEIKKTAEEVIAFRNRGIATTGLPEGEQPILAKASVKVPREENANEWMLGLYLGRTHETRVKRHDLISLRDQMTRGTDLVGFDHDLRVSLEPDMKRRLSDGRMAEIKCGTHAGQRHLATESDAFETVEEALMERQVFEAWRDQKQGVLKTTEDWAAWKEFRAAMLARKRSGASVKVTKGGGTDVLKRQVLRALVRGMWGLELGPMSYQEVAAWLSTAGFETSINEVKNGARKGNEPVAGVVGASAGVVPLLRAIIAGFPSVEWVRFFAPEDAERMVQLLAEVGNP